MGKIGIDFSSFKNRKKGEYFFDHSLVFIVLFLVCFGLVMIYSASYYKASTSKTFEYDATYYVKKQLFASIAGIVGMFVVAAIPYHFWKQFAVLGYFGSWVLIFAVKSPLGYGANGATRWIKVLGISIQPAEIAKLAIILALATWITKIGKGIRKWQGFASIFVIALPVFFMVWLITDNMSSALIIMGIAFVMLFVASPEYKIFGLIIGLGVSAVFLVIFGLTSEDGGMLKELLLMILDFRVDRILAWLYPEDYTTDTAFQTLQSLYAIGSGGLFGKGIGQGMQKLGYLPEVQNDMIFAMICEELGIFGGICIILLFALLIWRCMVIASNATDLFGALLVVGVLGHIAIQVFLNVAVVTKLFPNTGISLPFISYGGSSVVFLLAEIGLVLSVGRGIELKENA